MGELDALRVRDEVLQAMYWMAGENLGDAPAAAELARFLAVPAATLDPYLGALSSTGGSSESDTATADDRCGRGARQAWICRGVLGPDRPSAPRALAVVGLVVVLGVVLVKPFACLTCFFYHEVT
jgi:hypothetical protein